MSCIAAAPQPAPSPAEGTPVPLATLLAHEVALGHACLMRAGGAAVRLLDRSDARVPGSPVQLAAIGLAGLSARLMERNRRAITALGRLRKSGASPLVIVPPPPSASPRPAAPKRYAAPGQARGRLKNGNPVGDYAQAPRCGARTRVGGCCRQPAMRNGRCRMHGGRSTGARTPEGLRRCRTARLVHGCRTRALIGLRSRAAHAARRLRRLTALARTPMPLRPIPLPHAVGEGRGLPRRSAEGAKAGGGLSAWHGVDRPDCRRRAA